MPTSFSRVHIGNATRAFYDIVGHGELLQPASGLSDFESYERDNLALEMAPTCPISDMNSHDRFLYLQQPTGHGLGSRDRRAGNESQYQRRQTLPPTRACYSTSSGAANPTAAVAI